MHALNLLKETFRLLLDYCKTDEEEVLHLLTKLDVKDLRKEVDWFQVSLRGMQAYLGDNEGREVSSKVEKHQLGVVRDVAYDIEDILDEFMQYVQTRLHPNKLARFASKIMQWRQHGRISSKMDDINKKIEKINGLYSILHRYEHASSGSTARHEVMMHDDLDDDKIVGFDNLLQQLGDHLLHGELRRVSISVVGSGGSGKSVLVKSVYESKRVRQWFNWRAWVHVTRSFDPKKLLDDILQQFCPSSEKHIPQGLDTREKLRNHLQGKRYIVVLDDIWSRDDWESIKNPFPDNSHGSRIIVTTQNLAVASSCVVESPGHCILKLTPLPWPDAWCLFLKTAFRSSNGECAATLKNWAERILQKCEGLPLAIVAVGGLLSQKPPSPMEWQKLHDSLRYEIQTPNNLSVISKLLLPSYKDLRSNLKKCFLYFSNFPEDYAISPRRLIRLWVAERFVDARRGKSLEDVAEDYLNELVQRHLVHLI